MDDLLTNSSQQQNNSSNDNAEGEEGKGKEKAQENEMAPIGNPIHQFSSRRRLNLSGSEIQGSFEERDPTILLPNQSDDSSHLALDIGGSLIKLVYFSRHGESPAEDKRKGLMSQGMRFSSGIIRKYPIVGGLLHFVKFETCKLKECLDFIDSKKLHCGAGIILHSRHLCSSGSPCGEGAIIKATGGGAYKFADTFRERLGVSIDKEEEMDCLVTGANFLLKGIRHEGFTYVEGKKELVQIDQNDLFPYLLVSIGSGVSMIKVDGNAKFQRVSGTSLGGGTYWGLGRLLTNYKSFDELLELTQWGDNTVVDMLVGDIYGGHNYPKIGLSASTIASSFGKAISDNKECSDYRPKDILLSLLRMISFNIGQISYLIARYYGIKRIVFGGFFVRGHAYIMDTISYAVHFWSKGQAQAMFLRHEGFLGALGAFISYEKHGLDELIGPHLVERFPTGDPYLGRKSHGPQLRDLNGKDGVLLTNSTQEQNNPNKDKEKRNGKAQKKEMASVGNPIHRSSSRQQLHLGGAVIQGNFEERNPKFYSPNLSDDISHLALDIGGSLIKLVYFLRHEDNPSDNEGKMFMRQRMTSFNGITWKYPVLGGCLHFVKFETSKLKDCLDFIDSEKLHFGGGIISGNPCGENPTIKVGEHINMQTPSRRGLGSLLTKKMKWIAL